MFYIQLARGLTPTQSALLLIPMALLTGRARPVRRTGCSTAPTRASCSCPACCMVVGVAGLVLDAHERRHPDLDVPAALGPHGHRQRRHVGAARDHRDAQPADEPGGCRRRHLQHHPHRRLGDRLGRDRGVHAEPARGEPAGRGRRRPAASREARCPTPWSRASRPRWRRRSCCPQRSCCSAWSPCCSCGDRRRRARRSGTPRTRSWWRMPHATKRHADSSGAARTARASCVHATRAASGSRVGVERVDRRVVVERLDAAAPVAADLRLGGRQSERARR